MPNYKRFKELFYDMYPHKELHFLKRDNDKILDTDIIVDWDLEQYDTLVRIYMKKILRK